MAESVSKKVLVIKDIHSNLIEEAIVILKGGTGVSTGKPEGKTADSSKQDSSLLLKEAESIINIYLKENGVGEAPKKSVKEENDTDIKRRKLITNSIINMALAGSIILLIFVISKFF